MQITPATSDDTPAIYALLRELNFQNLPSYDLAKPVLEKAEALVIKQQEKILMWSSYHGEDEVLMDWAISPELPRNLITKGVCKRFLAHGLNLSQDGRMAVECCNSQSIKTALKLGFEMTDEQDREGWVKLMLTREMFERKYRMRG